MSIHRIILGRFGEHGLGRRRLLLRCFTMVDVSSRQEHQGGDETNVGHEFGHRVGPELTHVDQAPNDLNCPFVERVDAQEGDDRKRDRPQAGEAFLQHLVLERRQSEDRGLRHTKIKKAVDAHVIGLPNRSSILLRKDERAKLGISQSQQNVPVAGFRVAPADEVLAGEFMERCH